MKHMSPNESFLIGQRCGHIDGKDRVGCYVIGEELDLSEQAASAQADCVTVKVDLNSFAWGYADGYRTGASGDALEQVES